MAGCLSAVGEQRCVCSNEFTLLLAVKLQRCGNSAVISYQGLEELVLRVYQEVRV